MVVSKHNNFTKKISFLLQSQHYCKEIWSWMFNTLSLPKVKHTTAFGKKTLPRSRVRASKCCIYTSVLWVITLEDLGHWCKSLKSRVYGYSLTEYRSQHNKHWIMTSWISLFLNESRHAKIEKSRRWLENKNLRLKKKRIDNKNNTVVLFLLMTYLNPFDTKIKLTDLEKIHCYFCKLGISLLDPE